MKGSPYFAGKQSKGKNVTSKFIGVLTGLVLFCALIFLMAQKIPTSKKMNVSLEQATRICLENLDVLLADIAQNDFTRTEQIPAFESVSVEHRAIAGKPVFIDYACGGAGFGANTSYWGFYYSEDDDMSRIWCAGEPLTPLKNGYAYCQTDGDNRYYTEQITNHFFYYEAHF